MYDNNAIKQYRTFHFTGAEEPLDRLARAVLQASLEEIETAFQ